MKSVTCLTILLVLTVANASKNGGEASLGQRGDNKKNSSDRPLKYLIELRIQDTFVRHCGVAQLNAEWFLTAAECADFTKYDSSKLLGLDLHDKIRRLAMMWLEVKVHPEYNATSKENNIALIKTYPSGSGVDQYRLPSQSTFFEELATFWKRQYAVVSTWSNWPEAGSLTENNIETTTTNSLWCKLVYMSRFNRQKHLCISGVWGKALSQDNVGAPLLTVSSDKVEKIIGIATDIRPFTNALPMPMVFTKVEPYVGWIVNETNVQ